MKLAVENCMVGGGIGVGVGGGGGGGAGVLVAVTSGVIVAVGVRVGRGPPPPGSTGVGVRVGVAVGVGDCVGVRVGVPVESWAMEVSGGRAVSGTSGISVPRPGATMAVNCSARIVWIRAGSTGLNRPFCHAAYVARRALSTLSSTLGRPRPNRAN